MQGNILVKARERMGFFNVPQNLQNMDFAKGEHHPQPYTKQENAQNSQPKEKAFYCIFAHILPAVLQQSLRMLITLYLKL